MQVAKWGNSLAVRLPAELVRTLGLKEGDQIDLREGGRHDGKGPAHCLAPKKCWKGCAASGASCPLPNA